MIKGILLAILYHLGVMRLILFFYRNTIPILMIHGVIDDSKQYSWTPGWPRLTTTQLDNGLTILSRYFNFISYDDAIAMLSAEIPMKPYSIVLTFDDGYRNNLTQAHPITSKHGAASVYFIATDYTRKQRAYWIDRLDFALQTCCECSFDVRIGVVSREIDLNKKNLYETSYQELRLQLKKSYPNDQELNQAIDNYLEHLEQKNKSSIMDINRSDEWSGVLNEQEIENIPDDVDIGSHTVNHLRLDAINISDIEYEVRESKIYLENLTKKPCNHFCYPNGNSSQKAEAELKAAGYKSAVITRTGSNSRGGNLFQLKRIPFPNQISPSRFLFNLAKQLGRNETA